MGGTRLAIIPTPRGILVSQSGVVSLTPHLFLDFQLYNRSDSSLRTDILPALLQVYFILPWPDRASSMHDRIVLCRAGSDEMHMRRTATAVLQDIAQALDPRADLTTYRTESGGKHCWRHLLLQTTSPLINTRPRARCWLTVTDPSLVGTI